DKGHRSCTETHVPGRKVFSECLRSWSWSSSLSLFGVRFERFDAGQHVVEFYGPHREFEYSQGGSNLGTCLAAFQIAIERRGGCRAAALQHRYRGIDNLPPGLAERGGKRRFLEPVPQRPVCNA